MSINFARSGGRRGGRIAGLVAAGVAALSLVVAAPVGANGLIEGTATLAPIGTGSYLLTVTNTGSDPIGGFEMVGEGITNIAPSGICGNTGGGMFCTVEFAPTKSVQICYSGPAVEEVELGLTVPVNVTKASAVASCPVPGFTPASSGGGGGTGGGGSSGGGSGGGGGSTQPTVPPTTAPVKCKKGFKKKTVHGKAKCVKVKKHKH